MSLTYADAQSKSLSRKAFAVGGVVAVHIAVFFALSAARPSITVLKPLQDSVAVFIPLQPPKPKPLPKPPQVTQRVEAQELPVPQPDPVVVPDVPLVQDSGANAAIAATDTTPTVPANSFSITRRIDPTYPAASQRAGEQGTVVLNIVIGPDGKPLEVMVAKSSGFAALDEAALKAARQWRFATNVQGLARVSVPITFRLQGER